jgi:photosystem II stability/assembly factor-like uncharacterized protein
MSIRAVFAATLATLALAATPAAAVQLGSSSWQWASPLPQGVELDALSFAGATGYAAGQDGVLLKTTDGGATWSGLGLGTAEWLVNVQALDATTIFVAGAYCVARRSIDGGKTFTPLRYDPRGVHCRRSPRDLWFVSRDVGYVLGDDGAVLATRDGGATFQARTAVPETEAAGGHARPAALAFSDEQKGFATSGARLFRTLDGGRSWTLVATAAHPLFGLRIVDATRAFAVGEDGVVLRSDDGGATWAAKDLGVPTVDYYSIACSDAQRCVLTAAPHEDARYYNEIERRLLVRTTDGGDTAGTLVTPAGDPILAVAFASPTRVVGVGDIATVISDDGGASFRSVGEHLSDGFETLRLGGVAGSAYAIDGHGSIAKTTDRGRTWSAVGSIPTRYAYQPDVAFPTATDGYALLNGKLFRTGDGGTTWQALDHGSSRYVRALLAPSARTVLVVGKAGMRRSLDGGRTFAQVRAKAVSPAYLVGIARSRNGNAIFTWGSRLARSTDGGRTWVAVGLPEPTRRGGGVNRVAFLDARIGLLLDGGDRLWRTTNGGRSWTRLYGIGTSRNLDDLAIESPRSALLVGEDLWRTDDAGATWRPQFGTQLASGVAIGDGADYLLSSRGGLLFSTTGGAAGMRSKLTLARPPGPHLRGKSIVVSGRLQPPLAGAEVTVAKLFPGARFWHYQKAVTAADGTFRTTWWLRRGTTRFVAQWAGDGRTQGAGSRALAVTVPFK